MKVNLFVTTLIVSTALLNGCATIVSGKEQSVSVTTPPAQNATCELKNDKGSWFIGKTPQSVMVHRSYQDLQINCRKNGYQINHTEVPSKVQPWMFGNIIFGGVIGVVVDAVVGSGYNYPEKIQVPLKPKTI